MSEDEDGLLLPASAQLLNGPEEFVPGPHGQCLEALAHELAAKLVRPIFFVVRDDAGGVTGGPRKPGDRLFLARIGFNQQEHTELHVYGRLKPDATAELEHEVIPEGRPTECGRRVWTRHVHNHVHNREDTWDVDVYHDEQGFFWTIRQDLEHAQIGLEQRHRTRMQVLAAAIDHLREEDGVRGLLPVMTEP